MTCACRYDNELCPYCEQAAENRSFFARNYEASPQEADDQADKEARRCGRFC